MERMRFDGLDGMSFAERPRECRLPVCAKSRTVGSWYSRGGVAVIETIPEDELDCATRCGGSTLIVGVVRWTGADVMCRYGLGFGFGVVVPFLIAGRRSTDRDELDCDTRCGTRRGCSKFRVAGFLPSCAGATFRYGLDVGLNVMCGFPTFSCVVAGLSSASYEPGSFLGRFAGIGVLSLGVLEL